MADSKQPEIKFIRSDCPDPYNGLGYNVWTNEYTDYFKTVGFISNKNMPDMRNYFTLEGYRVKVIEDPDSLANSAYQTTLDIFD